MPAFSVDLFAVHFLDMNGPAGHLIGIREAGSHGGVPELATPTLRDASNVVAQQAQARSTSFTSRPSSRTSSESVKTARPLELTRIGLEIDAGTPEIEVRA